MKFKLGERIYPTLEIASPISLGVAPVASIARISNGLYGTQALESLILAYEATGEPLPEPVTLITH